MHGSTQPGPSCVWLVSLKHDCESPRCCACGDLLFLNISFIFGRAGSPLLRASSRCGRRGLLWSLRGPLIAVAVLVSGPGPSGTGSAVVAHGLGCSATCGIIPDQGLHSCPLHWRVDSFTAEPPGSPQSSPFFLDSCAASDESTQSLSHHCSQDAEELGPRCLCGPRPRPQSQLLPTTDGSSVPAVLPSRLHKNTAVQCVGSVTGSSGSAGTRLTELSEPFCRACLFTALQTPSRV